MSHRVTAVPLPGGFEEPEPEPEPELEPQFLTVDDVAAPTVQHTGESSDDGSDGSEGGLPAAYHVGGLSGPARPMTLADLAARSSTDSPAQVAPGTHFRCVKKAAVRAGFELESERLSFLEPGEEIEVLETRINDRGQLRVRYDAGWTSIESAAGSVLLVRMQLDPSDPPPLSQWATAALASGCEPVSQDAGEELELESENPAFSAHLQEMELASRLLAEGGKPMYTLPAL